MRPATRGSSSDALPGGNLDRLPALEVLAGRLSCNLGRLTGANAFAALVIGGSILLMFPMGGWHHTLGEVLIVTGIIGMLITPIGEWLRNRGQRIDPRPLR